MLKIGDILIGKLCGCKYKILKINYNKKKQMESIIALTSENKEIEITCTGKVWFVHNGININI